MDQVIPNVIPVVPVDNAINVTPDVPVEPVQVARKAKVCHAVTIVDRSGSMDLIRVEAHQAINNDIKNAKESNKKIPTRISITTFSNVADDPTIWDRPADEVEEIPFENYKPEGWTAMLDAVGLGISLLKDLPDANDEDTVFLVSIISDGEENHSRKETYESIAAKIQECQATGRWTFTYQGANQNLGVLSQRLSIPKGNMQMFAATSQGMQAASVSRSMMYQDMSERYSQGVYACECAFDGPDADPIPIPLAKSGDAEAVEIPLA